MTLDKIKHDDKSIELIINNLDDACNNNKTTLNIKELYNQFDIVIEKSISNGCIFFGLTINLIPYEVIKMYEQLPDNEKPKLPTAEEYLNFHIKLLSSIDLIEFSYSVIEYNKQGLPHVHSLICIRSLLGYNYSMSTGIKELILHYYDDYNLQYLISFNKIKKTFIYITKEFNFNNHSFVKYSHILDYFNIYGALVDYFIKVQEELCYFNKQIFNTITGRHNNLLGYNSTKKDANLIIFLWNTYLALTNTFIQGNNLYRYNPKSKYSYECLDTLNYLKNNKDQIIQTLLKECPIQLKNYPLYNLFLAESDNAFTVINKDPTLLLYKKTIRFDIVEFKDGIYFSKYDSFIPHNRINEYCLNKKINNPFISTGCFRYFNISYRHLVRDIKPKLWFSYLKANFNTYEELEVFCGYYGKLFHSNLNNLNVPKKSTLYVQGTSNSGKSLLLTKTMIYFYGMNNIGLLSKGNFSMEQLIGKLVLIFDEFEFNKASRSSLLKLINKEPLLVNQKYKKHIQLVNESPLIISCNEGINEALLDDIAFENRLLMYTFNSTINLENIDKTKINKLKKELPKIFLYCNKLFLNNHVKNHKKRYNLSYILKVNKLNVSNTDIVLK